MDNSSSSSSSIGRERPMRRRSAVGFLVHRAGAASFKQFLKTDVAHQPPLLISIHLPPLKEVDENLWFTSLDDFIRPPIMVLHEQPISTTYYLKAKISRKNFVLHEYSKSTVSRPHLAGEVRQLSLENLDEKNEKRVTRLVGFMQWIRHPHIIKCFGAWEDPVAYYVVEEYCHRNHLLGQCMTNKRTITEEFLVTKILKPLLKALVYLHEMNIAHRSVIPENVYFGKGDDLRLTGFLTAIECSRSRPTSRLGPLDYTPPEVLKIEQHSTGVECCDEKIDIWQVGVLAYEMLSGACPFEVQDITVTSQCIAWAEIRSFSGEFSPQAVNFIQQCLRKKPRERPTALELSKHPWIRLFERRATIVATIARSKGLWRLLMLRDQILSLWNQRQTRIAPLHPSDEKRKRQPENRDGHEEAVVTINENPTVIESRSTPFAQQ